MASTTTATMAMLNTKYLSIKIPKTHLVSNQIVKLENSQKSLTTPKKTTSNLSSSLTGTAIAGAIFSTLGSTNPALAAQQIAVLAEGDNRGLALLLPIIPAIAWVLFNILQPALNQLNRMRSDQGVVLGLGLGGLAASSFFLMPSAAASEIALVGEASSDNRGTLLLLVVAPALLWVLYNILQPALNQLNRMLSDDNRK